MIHRIKNKIIILFLIIINRTILAPFRAKKEYTPIFEKLLEMGIYGLNHSRLGSPMVSGEREMLRELKPKLNSSGLVIIDIGAHKGEYIDILLEEFNGFQIIIHAMEPSNKLFLELKRKYSSYNNVHIWNIAIGSKNGKSYLINSESKIAHVSNEKPINENFEVIHCMTLETFCVQNNIDKIDLLKIDAEGSEYDILRSSKDFIFEKLKPEFVQFEFGTNNATLPQGVHFAAFYELFSKSGYTVFKVAKNGISPLPDKISTREIYYSANYLAILNK